MGGILYEKDQDTPIEHSRIVLGQYMLIGMVTKDRDTLIEQSPCTNILIEQSHMLVSSRYCN